MKIELWYLLIGGLFVLVTMAGTLIRRLPMTLTIHYLAAGLALGPMGLGVVGIGAIDHANLLEHLTELAVIVSLFTAG
jgi:sodium/hydrogen antiporter